MSAVSGSINLFFKQGSGPAGAADPSCFNPLRGTLLHPFSLRSTGGTY